jgi:hypothetical protein
LRGGSFDWMSVDAPDVLGWIRGEGREAVLVLLNFSAEERQVGWVGPDHARWRPLVGTDTEPPHLTGPASVTLGGLEGALFVRG